MFGALRNDEQTPDDEESFIFAEQEQSVDVQPPIYLPWKILIVDDDEDVHLVTKMVLDALSYSGRGLTFVQAYSAKQAKEMIANHPDIAVAIVDVVMEEDDAGLKLVKWLRSEYGNRHLRIILRTGQPGMAPEDSIIENYEINDYKTKSELSSQKLKTSIVSALRSYRDIVTIERTRDGLEMMLDASASFYTADSIQQFTNGLMHQIVALLQLDENPRYVNEGGVFVFSNPDYKILSGYGLFSGREGGFLSAEEIEIIKQHRADNAIDSDEEMMDYEIVFSLENFSYPITIFIRSVRPISKVDRNLVNLFVRKSAIALENLILQENYHSAQNCIIRSLAHLTEFRDNDTGGHIERVEVICERLTDELLKREYYQDLLTPDFKQMIGLASMLHDIGKVGVKDKILLKPDRLTEEEWAEMKKHAELGANVLKQANALLNRDAPLLKMAEQIALSHHERWDGKGYPLGLKGNEIPLAARIMAVVDVYDALVSERPYKKAWSVEDALTLIEEESGKHFDPLIAKTFVELCRETAFAKLA